MPSLPKARTLVFPAACALLAALGSCSAPAIDPAQPGQALAAGTRHLPTHIWPRRPQPTEPSFQVKRGQHPIDVGTYGNCRLCMAGEVKDGFALVVAGSRFNAIKDDDKPFELTVVGRNQTNEIDLKVRDHRITLAVVRAARAKVPRGLVIYLASIMLISDEERGFLNKLQQSGWNVMAITPSLDLFAKDRWQLDWHESQVDAQATTLAREIDDYLAETAYAAEAVLAFLRKDNPKWTAGHRVVIGASAGSLAAPALIQRIGGADAAIFIGAGAHVPEVVLESALDIYRPEIELLDGDTLSSDARRQRRVAVRRSLKNLALQRSRLDPLHLAPGLADIPTLMLSAERDRIVPAHTGDILYNALGKPERWRYPGGHVLLFLGLPRQADRVTDWIERAVSR